LAGHSAGEADMLVLALDTTTGSGSVALLDATRFLGEINAESSGSYSVRLLRAVDFLLRANSLKIEDMDGFAVAAGPGSFTGIRIGLSTIKAFAFALGKQVAPVSTLFALASKLKDSPSHLISPLVDAKKGEIYTALFESRGESLEEVIPQGAYAPDRFFSLLPAHRNITFIGNGVEVYRQKILAYLKDKARFSSRSLFIAYEVGVLGREILKQGRGVNGENLQPIYFRKSQAEERK
jgi:tRNA threonylcarbamoyladenosine biosynthesis protein TsaB